MRRKRTKNEETAHSGLNAGEGKGQGAGERSKRAEDDYKNRIFVPLLPKPHGNANSIAAVFLPVAPAAHSTPADQICGRGRHQRTGYG
jgi:hypothetical protein